MDAKFWKKAWNEGRTAFHQRDFHEKLTEFFSRLQPQSGEKVLVPLCGKSKDLLWLHELNLHVHGVELHDQAVEAFFSENKLSPVKKTQNRNFTRYNYGNIFIRCGDFFKLDENDIYDLIYDRAALVALPQTMRQDYAQVIKKAVKKNGRYLLIVYEYDQTKLDGPPFSVAADEIRDLYEDQFAISLVESTAPRNEGARLSSLESLRQKVYILEKTR
jgi:thiopurine S-methyltransferase